MAGPDEQHVRSLERRAGEGDLEAQYEMSWRLATGMGLPPDDGASIGWLERAARGGHRLAQNNLGARFATGDGVGRDPLEAWVWFSRAERQGDRKAGKNRQSMERELDSGRLAEARRRLEGEDPSRGGS